MPSTGVETRLWHSSKTSKSERIRPHIIYDLGLSVCLDCANVHLCDVRWEYYACNFTDQQYLVNMYEVYFKSEVHD